jgi:chemotaxis protein CheD
MKTIVRLEPLVPELDPSELVEDGSEHGSDGESSEAFGPDPLARARHHHRGVDRNGVPVVYLLPGELVAVGGDAPRTLVTILGSCVSVCLWDRRGRGGGMNHFLLPRRTPDAPRSGRHGDSAVALLVSRLLGLGAERADLRAKVFGGAHVLPGAAAGGRTLGGDNVQVALRALRDQGVALVSEDVGGTRGRKLAFNTVDGTALVWRL